MSINKKSLSLIFEITHGCQYSCSGCTVNKNVSDLPTPQQFEELELFLNNVKDQGYNLNEFELAPTDSITSLNIERIFQSQDFIKTLNKFSLFAMTVGLILPDPQRYIDYFEKVIKIYPEGKIDIATPIELEHVYTDKYTSVINKNIDIIKSILGDRLNDIILQVNFDYRFFTKDINKQFQCDKFFNKLHGMELNHNYKVNMAFLQGRNNFDNQYSRETFRDSVVGLHNLYIDNIKKNKDCLSLKHIPYQFFKSEHGGEVIWNQGELYIRPIINERFTLFNDDRRVERPWTLESLLCSFNNMFYNSLEIAQDIEDCQNCHSLVSCANRGVQSIMKSSGIEKCFMLLKDNEYFNNKIITNNIDTVDVELLNKIS